MNKVPHICVCFCTLKRPELLRRLLASLAEQITNDKFTFSIVVTDNDAEGSARVIVSEFAAARKIDVVYCVEPEKSISAARNRGLALAKGEYIAIIDDDEFPVADWLLRLFEAQAKFGAQGVFGPVRAHFDSAPPNWLIKGKFCERPEHETGFVMPWGECRTGNVLIEHSIIKDLNPVFESAFGAGASDIDLFRRLMERGCKFVWCNEAVVHEVVLPNRWKRGFMIRRALLRGRIALRHPGGKVLSVAKSAIAVPAYGLALPFALIAGQHVFVKLLVKLCDHGGKLLALCGMNPVKEREL